MMAPITEVFPSIQGEGPYVGINQLFVRFSHCHLACTYCDTAMTQPDGTAHIYTKTNATQYDTLENPVSTKALLNRLMPLLSSGLYHSVSFTGGEPLLYHRFLAELFPLIQPLAKTYLETSGTQPDFLKAVLPHTDIIAMDIKLPSATGERFFIEEHRDFIKQAISSPTTELLTKVVFNDAVTKHELATLEQLLSPYPHVPLILQPESMPDGQPNLSADTLFHVQQHLLSAGLPVRVIPQTHKQLALQ